MIKLKIWGNIGPKTSYAVEQAIAEKRDDNEPIMIVINSLGRKFTRYCCNSKFT